MKNTELVKIILNEEIYESLNKALVKLKTNSVVDLEELHAALKTVPKSVIMFLMRELNGIEKDETREIQIPWHPNSFLNITKQGDDVYKGRLVKDAEVVHNFDLTAIPQLGAHLMSAFELYSGDDEEKSLSSSSSSSSDEDIKRKLYSLEDKINTLFSVLSRQEPQFIKKEKALEKAGIMPTMPKPGKPGVQDGSQHGISHKGLIRTKAPGIDNKSKPKMAMKDPKLEAAKKQVRQNQLTKIPKIPTTIKSENKKLTFKKSELDGRCPDCGKPSYPPCACFRALSKPEIKKTENDKIILSFKDDWDNEAIRTLYHNIVRSRNG